MTKSTLTAANSGGESAARQESSPRPAGPLEIAMRPYPLALCLLAFLAAGCGDSGPKEPCGVCGGSGRAYAGHACSFCDGRGYRTVSGGEASRRQMAEENLRRRERGEAPLSDGEWWWERHGGKLVGFAVVGAALYLANWRPRKKAG